MSDLKNTIKKYTVFMKILFYDMGNFELDYFLEKIPNNIEPVFFKKTLNSSAYIDTKNLDTEALSVFVTSDLNREVLSKFKNLKYIFLRCVGFSNVDLNYCKENDILVFNTPNYGNSTVAEYAFTLILMLSKKILQSKNDLYEGKVERDEITGIELFKKIIGVVGAGAIGKEIISIAKGFKMDVLVYDLKKNDDYNFVSFDELLTKSDFVVVSCPLTENTRKMFNKEAFSKMKKTAVFVNVARGEIVDTEALYNAIINKKLFACGLDVVECEEMLCESYKKCLKNDNLKEHCLKKYFFIQKMMKLDNVIITPHNAFNTFDAQIRILNMTLENIKASFDINSGTKNLVLI